MLGKSSPGLSGRLMFCPQPFGRSLSCGRRQRSFINNPKWIPHNWILRIFEHFSACRPGNGHNTSAQLSVVLLFHKQNSHTSGRSTTSWVGDHPGRCSAKLSLSSVAI